MGEIKVKPLEWRDGVEGGMWVGDGAFSHRYQIERRAPITRDRKATFSVRFDHVDEGTLAYCDTLDAAKAAAQADYDKRILSALIPETSSTAFSSEGWDTLYNTFRKMGEA